jgi:hypothetical protein
MIHLTAFDWFALITLLSISFAAIALAVPQWWP